MSVAPRAMGLVILLAATGCGGQPGDATSPGGPRFELVRGATGLDVVQICGNHDADFIIDTVGSGGAWLDYDGDGDPDLYLAQGASRNEPQGPPDLLLRNDGDPDGDGVPRFVDVSEAAGLGDRLWSFGVAVADYDNDGDPDIYLTNWGPNRLYRNNGDGTFTELGGPAGVDHDGWGLSAIWSDTDLDGDLDLYVTNYVVFDFDRYPSRGVAGKKGEPPCRWRNLEVMCGPRNLEPEPDVLYRNDGDPDGDGIPVFVEVTREAGLVPVEALYAMAALFFDGDGDGDEDLYVANDSLVNTYFINNADGTFEEATLLSGLAFNEQGHEQAGMGIAAADFNRDGRLDLAVTNFSHDHDTLYRNDGNNTFTDVSYPAGIASASFFTLAWGVVFDDFDHDGWDDLYMAHGHVYPEVDQSEAGTSYAQANSVFRDLGGGVFEEVSATAGSGLEPVENSRSALPADIDGDGDIDLLITNLNAPPHLLRNDGADGHWLQIRLHGTRSTRDGIGAVVTVVTGPRRHTRAVTRTASYLGSTIPIAHFGLGEADRVDRVEVRWPSGLHSVEESVDVDRILLIREPTR